MVKYGQPIQRSAGHPCPGIVRNEEYGSRDLHLMRLRHHVHARSEDGKEFIFGGSSAIEVATGGHAFFASLEF